MATACGQNWDDGDRLDIAPSSKFTLRTGQLLTPRLGLGLIVESGGSKKDQIQAGLFGLGIEGHVALVKNLALRGSVSLGVLQIKDDADPDDLKGTYGAQYGVGLSYDFFPTSFQGSGGFAITPTIDVRALAGDTAANFGRVRRGRVRLVDRPAPQPARVARQRSLQEVSGGQINWSSAASTEPT